MGASVDAERKKPSGFQFVEVLPVLEVTRSPGNPFRGWKEGHGVGLDLDTLHTWDGRFTPEDIKPGDLVVMASTGPATGYITHIMREGKVVFKVEINEQL